MANEVSGTIEVEDRGAVLVARLDGGPLGLFGNQIAEQLDALVERADRLKRAVYFGGSMSLPDGLHVERAELLTTALSKIGQELMLDYMRNTEQAGELPLYSPGVYEEVLESGTTRGAGARGNGAPMQERP
jgi:hypothetical protein